MITSQQLNNFWNNYHREKERLGVTFGAYVLGHLRLTEQYPSLAEEIDATTAYQELAREFVRDVVPIRTY